MTNARKASLLFRVKQFGGPINEPAILAQFLAQVEHESGGYKYVREIWGPTAAQKRYEGRKDLGNTQPGDGKRFMGRDLLQVTGRANYRALTAWVRKTFGATVDFEASPELLESPEWLGIGAIWYFLTRKGLIAACRAGDIEKVTKMVNGGLNGYDDRLERYGAIALDMLGYKDVRAFQRNVGLKPDGVIGHLTRAKMHECLSHKMTRPVANSDATPVAPHVNEKPKSEHEQTDVLKPATKGRAHGMLGGLILALAAGYAALAAGAREWLGDVMDRLANLFG